MNLQRSTVKQYCSRITTTVEIEGKKSNLKLESVILVVVNIMQVTASLCKSNCLKPVMHGFTNIEASMAISMTN